MRRLDNTENVLPGRVAPSQYLLRDDDMRNINKYLPRYSFRAGGGATFLRKFCCHRQVWYVSWLDSRGCGQIGRFTPSILLSSWETALLCLHNHLIIYSGISIIRYTTLYPKIDPDTIIIISAPASECWLGGDECDGTRPDLVHGVRGQCSEETLWSVRVQAQQLSLRHCQSHCPRW